MVVDSSALLAVVLAERDRLAILRAMADAAAIKLSAASAIEASMLAYFRKSHVGDRALDGLIDQFDIDIVPVDREQVRIARRAFLIYGKGRHPAGLNFGDLFAYALSKATGEPLLFKGDDFRKTDVEPAL